MERVNFTDTRRRRVSWGSIIGGVITVLAISVLLSILSTSISFFKFDPLSSNPAHGIGTTMGIWTVVSLILSLCAGGFVAGKLAGTDGVIHGFLTWATTMIVTLLLVVSMVSGAFRMAGNVLGSVSTAAGHVVSGVGSAVGQGMSGMMKEAEGVFGDLDIHDIDRAEVRQDVRQALRRSGIKELQPEYLDRQVKVVRNDLRKSVRKLATNPNDADKVIDGFTTRLEDRVKNITRNLDRNDLVRVISANTNLTRAEADKAVDEYIELYQNIQTQANEQIENLQENIQEARANWEQTKQQALVTADKATNAAGRGSLIAFFALLIGAGIACGAGYFGTRTTKEGIEV